jgi:hypothetical protein
MLGFATVDLSEHDQTLTVWLTSVITLRGAEIGHTNAAGFPLADEPTARLAWSMACDRYVVLTDRTPGGHSVFADWDLAPCDLGLLAQEAVTAQNSLMDAFTTYVATKRGKAAELIEPELPPVPPPLDQSSLDGEVPAQFTLAVANQVKNTWQAWFTAERERVKRWNYMPGGRKDEPAASLPAGFTERSAVQPVRAWRR